MGEELNVVECPARERKMQMDIHEFRDFVNSFHAGFVRHQFSDVGGKSIWNCICSAMDWLTEAHGALGEFEKRAKRKDAGWIDLYGYIVCVDVIAEATEQLHRCVFGRGEKSVSLSFPDQCFVTRPKEFAGLSDRAYFKELRSIFGAHSVNLRDPQTSDKKRFASWVVPGQIVGNDGDFAVFIYSSIKGEADILLSVKLDELKAFCCLYQSRLEAVAAEIRRQGDVFDRECRKRPVRRSGNPVEQWEILVQEARSRCLGGWDANVPEIFSVKPKHPGNCKLLSDYQDVIRQLLVRMADAFQRMDASNIRELCEEFHRVLYPAHPQEKWLSYCLAKLFENNRPYTALKEEIETFFGNHVDFPSIVSDVERRVLVRAALFNLSGDAPLKRVLRTRCLPDLKGKCLYFNRDTLFKWLKGARVSYALPTLNRYMAELMETGEVWGAGRGWYSFIGTSVTLDAEPVAGIRKELQNRFPLLDFACWSTQQINPYMHHMLAKFVTFVHVPRDTMPSVYDYLKESGRYSVYLNPTRREADKTFSFRDKTVVVRPLLSKTPVRERQIKVEGILVDLVVEQGGISVMDQDELKGMVTQLATSNRVELAELISYARRRGVALQDLFGGTESIISCLARNGR